MDLLLKKHDYADELIEQLQNLSIERAAEIEARGEFGVDLSWETGEAFDAGRFSVQIWNGSYAYAGPNTITVPKFKLRRFDDELAAELADVLEEIWDGRKDSA